jgi:integrase
MTTRGLGSFPAVSLADARKSAASAVKEAKESAPAPEPKTEPVPTFGKAARDYINANSPTWTNPKHVAQWRNTLARYADPHIGNRPVSEVTTGDVLAVLEPIWLEKRETASRVRQRIEKIFDWAIVHNHRERANPATKAILVGLPKVRQAKEHHRALPYGEVPEALRKVELSTANPLTRLGFKFLVLTAARSGEVRGADWSEVDWDARMWTVPAARMKAGREHRVPLSDQAMGVLRDGWTLGSGEGLIFRAKESGQLSDMVFTALLRRLKVDCVPHGFRSSFRDWCAETGVARDLAEASLSHSLGGAVETAYLRSDLAEQRRELMQQWADFCAG